MRMSCGRSGARRLAVVFDLLHEPLGAEHGGEFGPEDLVGDVAVVLDVVGGIDRCHDALTDLALDPVPVRQRGGEALDSRTRSNSEGRRTGVCLRIAEAREGFGDGAGGD